MNYYLGMIQPFPDVCPFLPAFGLRSVSRQMIDEADMMTTICLTKLEVLEGSAYQN